MMPAVGGTDAKTNATSGAAANGTAAIRMAAIGNATPGIAVGQAGCSDLADREGR